MQIMQVVYANEDVPLTIKRSLFLAGPTARSHGVRSWRPEALSLLCKLGFDGTVFVPERNKEKKKVKKDEFHYQSQVEWEEKCLNIADCIVFWVPRSDALPGLTTNIEWGTWCRSGKVVLGCPKGAERVRYMQYYAGKYRIPMAVTLSDTLTLAINAVGAGAERQAGERYVPLLIWNLPSFQSWLKALVNAGNRLDHATLLYNYRSRNDVFLWILKVSIYVMSEKRLKSGEFVVSRPDTVSTVMWHPQCNWLDSEVVLVREFRSPVRTSDGFIHELPGGSSPSLSDPLDVAREEVHEETGFKLEPSRMISHGQRQVMGTLSSHTCSLYSVRLTEEEVEWFRSRAGIAHGNVEESERTYVEVHTLRSLLDKPLIDWSTMGQIMSVIRPDSLIRPDSFIRPDSLTSEST